jgi:CubicO group peptidase (beta-lactamase class C family)
LLSLAFVVVTACADPVNRDSPDFARLDGYLRQYQAAGDFQGVVLVARGDNTLFAKAYGSADLNGQTPITLDHAFRIASLSKTFTAGAIALLAQQGRLSLADPVSRFLPEFPNGGNITIQHLLSHTSGVGVPDTPTYDRRCFSLAELVRLIGEARPQYPPGSRSEYSNEGYILLAAIIEKVSGRSYADFLQENIFGPLEMSHTGTMCQRWPVERHVVGSIAGLAQGSMELPYEQPAKDGAGSVYSTAGDLLRWLRAINTGKLYPIKSQEWPWGWGRRNYSGRVLAEQSGQLEGYTSHMAFYYDENLYFVVLNRIESGMFGRLPGDIEAILFDTGQLSVPPLVRETADPASNLADFTGVYRTPDIPVPQYIELTDGRLGMHWGDSDFNRPLLRTGADEFFERAEYGTVSFVRDSTGRVTSAEWRWGGDPLVLRKDGS